jgi:PAS domain S-box-containing protein
MTPIYFARVVLLAVLYVLTGKLGLAIAVPPGYATVIWPPSGLALGFLLLHGPRLWPGVLIGSFVLNAYHSGALADPSATDPRLLAAFCIALGSTAQGLVGRMLVARFVGLPLHLSALRDIGRLLLLAGPLTCIVAATIGVGSLFALGIADRADLTSNWFAWWSGDTLGVLVFMPLVLLAPGARDPVTWRESRVGRLPLAALLLLLLPLGLTFYAWKATTENDYQRGEAKFTTLTVESEKALQNRLASYGNALLGAAGFIQGSSAVSREEWRTYVDTIQLRDNFPGMSGMGWAQPVADEDLPSFLAQVRTDGAPDFSVHPAVPGGPNYIVTFIEPQADNAPSLGLNIAFEGKRLATATQARDSGQPAMTGRVVLVQDQQQSPGFVMFYPVYHRDMAVGTAEARRAAFRGWAFAPFVARNFLDDLTMGQSTDYRVRIYDGAGESADALIYASDPGKHPRSTFTRRSTLKTLQRDWLLVWESTAAFERAERSTNPLFILIGGLLFTALMALLLVVLTVRRTEHIEQMVGERRFMVPLLVFVVIGAASFALYSKLRGQEVEFVRRQAQDEASKVESLLRSQANERIASLARMAARWESAGGTPYHLWRRDAANHVSQLPGLRSLEWIDTSYRVRWVEPLAGNESAVGLDVRLDAPRAAALRGAAQRNRATLTPPLRLVQGHAAFIAYVPLRKEGRLDGFLAGVFGIDDFFFGAIGAELSRNYTMEMSHGGSVYFSNAREAATPVAAMTEKAMRIEDQIWNLRIAPTPAFVASQKSTLPSLVFAAGLLVAALAALSVRYILISRLQSGRLRKSLALNAGIISSSAHLVIAIDTQYRIVIFNKAAELALGFSAAEIVGRRAIPIFLDAAELDQRAKSLSEELGRTIVTGPQIFTSIPLRDGFETREWTFIRKDGSRFPVNVTITPLRDEAGVVTGFLGVIEDITARREVDRLKSEFTAVVSHELRTPLTSIRGSLGLIQGALSSSLPAKVRDLLDIAQNNCERLVLLVNDILDMEKFTAGQMRFDVHTLPLAAVTLQAVEANEGYARKHNVHIELAPTNPESFVAVDPDRFIQVMSNLLSNAAKYSPPGGTVRVFSERRGDHVRISVRDEGPGIPEDFRERIFEKFSQADSSATREKGGTGLGLHIARRFVEHMNGRIGFDSEPGHGSTFWVELPLANHVAAGNH